MRLKQLTGQSSLKAIAIATLMGVGSSAVLATGAYADQLDDAIKLRAQGIVQSAQSQKRVDELDDQRSDLLQDYKATLKKLESLQVYNRQLEELIEGQRQRMVELQGDIDEATLKKREITPLMYRMIDGLEKFIELDVPFSLEERKTRVTVLRDLMKDPEVSDAERYRKIMEAFDIENEYGRGLSTYSTTIQLDGQDIQVEMLSVGRVALIYKTADGSRMGKWNQRARQWEDLDSDYATNVSRAYRIAKKQEAPNLILLPMPGPEVAQ